MDKFMGFDAETGGVTTDCSLLTMFFTVMDNDLNEVDKLHLKVKPNNGAAYIVTAEALRINKIDLVEHDKVAITESEAGRLLREFLVKHSENGKVKIIPVGHNVGFDEDFIWMHLLNRREYHKYMSYRKLDTGVIAQFLKKKGLIPNTVSGSLTSLVEHYCLKFKGEAHQEDADTYATVDVLKEMLKQ